MDASKPRDRSETSTPTSDVGRASHTKSEQEVGDGVLCRQLVEGLQDAIFVLDTAARVIYVNQAASQMLGMPESEIRGQLIEALFPFEVAAQHASRVRSVIETREPYLGEAWTQLASGAVWQSVSLVPLLGEDGEVVAVYGLARDVTERKLAEETLRASERQYRALVEAVGDLVFVIDRDDRVQYVNESAARWFGRPPDEIVGMQRRDLFQGEQGWAERQTQTLHRVFETGEPLYVEDKAEFPGGARWQGTSLAPVRDEGGQVVSVIGIGRDVTERKLAEEALSATNAELELRLAVIERVSAQMSALNHLGQMLQGCRTEAEVCEVFDSLARELFPQTSGCLAVRVRGGQLVEGVAEWGDAATFETVFSPNDCWALRLGRHFLAEGGGVHCTHVRNQTEGGSLCVPLTAEGESFGVLSLASSGGVDLGDEMALHHAVSVSEQMALALGNVRLRRRLEDQAVRDPVTRLHNRRYLDDEFERECRRARRSGASVAIVMFDVDRLKEVNDAYGHAAGDLLLRACGEAMTGAVRAEDSACRVGGDEFVVVLPGASLADAADKAEEIRALASALTLAESGREIGRATLSAGVAVFPEHGAEPEDVIAAADAALYQAKERGRDCVVRAE